MATQFEKRKLKASGTEEEAAALEPTGVAIDVLFDEKTRTFFRVSVSYNKETGRAEVTSIEDVGRDQALTMYKTTEHFSKRIILRRDK